MRTWKCGGEAPKPFDLCLELKGGGQVYRYFNRTGWVVRPHGGLAKELAWLAPSVNAALAQPADEPAQAPAGASAGCWQPGGP